MTAVAEDLEPFFSCIKAYRNIFFETAGDYVTRAGLPVRIDCFGYGPDAGEPDSAFATGIIAGKLHFWQVDGRHCTNAEYDLVQARPWLSLGRFWSLFDEMAADPEWAPHIFWSEKLERVTDADTIARELIFVICNSGMHRVVARRIYNSVIEELIHDGSAGNVFRHEGKAKAIDAIWTSRESLPAQLSTLDDVALLKWCGELPWIGKITKYHAAKNLGADVAKPDRHLVRLAAAAGEDIEAYCARLHKETGLRVATVDLVLWWALANQRLELTGERA